MSWWQYLTDLGDAAFLAGFAIGITIWLGASPSWTSVRIWIVTFGAALAAVITTKLAFLGWGLGIRSLDFTGMSGHATMAAAIFPTLAYLLCWRARTAAARVAGIVFGFALAIAIGVSRVVLDAHSISEVVTGLIAGSAVSLTVVCTYRVPVELSRPWLPSLVLLGMLGCGLAFYGQRAHAQHVLVRAALSLSGRDRPFTRVTWRTQRSTPMPQQSSGTKDVGH